MISGLGFRRWGWFKPVSTLSRHFRTITFDVRGEQNLTHGVADLCAEVIALLDHLGVKMTHVLGTSLGGFVAQELALDRPDLANRLLLICTSYGGVGPEPMSPQAFGSMLGWGSLSPESAVRKGLEMATSDTYRTEQPEEFFSKSRNTPFAGRRLKGWAETTIVRGQVVFAREPGGTGRAPAAPGRLRLGQPSS